jgi:hypothetical protein
MANTNFKVQQSINSSPPERSVSQILREHSVTQIFSHFAPTKCKNHKILKVIHTIHVNFHNVCISVSQSPSGKHCENKHGLYVVCINLSFWRLIKAKWLKVCVYSVSASLDYKLILSTNKIPFQQGQISFFKSHWLLFKR